MTKIVTSLTLILSFFCANIFGQETVKKSLYYPTDGYKLTYKQKKQLIVFLDSAFKSRNDAQSIIIEGNTDSAASKEYNIKLSQRRSGEVYSFIKEKGITNVKTEVRSHGENKPRYNYSKPDGMAKNRRVDVEIKYPLLPSLTNNNSRTTIKDLYKLLETSADTFLINNNYDTIIQASNGTIVTIPANVFCGKENKWSDVKLAVKEFLNTSSMLSQNTSTGSGNNLLITGGMVQVSAFDEKGKALSICDGNSFTVLMPTNKPDTTMQLFFASRDSSHDLDWELPDPDQRIQVIRGNIFQNCYEPSSSGTGNVKCRLFFCKMRNAFKAVFKPRFKSTTRKYMNYQQRQLAMGLRLNCIDRAKKINELESKFKAINGGRLQDLTSADASYYIFNSTNMGYINCDRYLRLPPSQLTNVTLPLESDPATDIKLVLSNDNAIMPSYNLNGKIGFPNVPKGAKAKLLGLRFENGKPSLALKEITIGKENNELTLEFKDYSLQEMKKMLDKM